MHKAETKRDHIEKIRIEIDQQNILDNFQKYLHFVSF